MKINRYMYISSQGAVKYTYFRCRRSSIEKLMSHTLNQIKQRALIDSQEIAQRVSSLEQYHKKYITNTNSAWRRFLSFFPCCRKKLDLRLEKMKVAKKALEDKLKELKNTEFEMSITPNRRFWCNKWDLMSASALKGEKRKIFEKNFLEVNIQNVLRMHIGRIDLTFEMITKHLKNELNKELLEKHIKNDFYFAATLIYYTGVKGEDSLALTELYHQCSEIWLKHLSVENIKMAMELMGQIDDVDIMKKAAEIEDLFNEYVRQCEVEWSQHVSNPVGPL